MNQLSKERIQEIVKEHKGSTAKVAKVVTRNYNNREEADKALSELPQMTPKSKKAIIACFDEMFGKSRKKAATKKKAVVAEKGDKPKSSSSTSKWAYPEDLDKAEYKSHRVKLRREKGKLEKAITDADNPNAEKKAKAAFNKFIKENTIQE